MTGNLFDSENDFKSLVDDRIEKLLGEVRVMGPPIDAILVAKRRGIAVVFDASQEPRGRQVKIGGRSSIFIRPDDRMERQQWAVAHELGESLVHELFDARGLDDAEIAPRLREQAANLAASRLLLPGPWFVELAGNCDGDLFELKERFQTASHELIAFRLLDLAAPQVVTVFDQGRQTRRRGNLRSGLPPLDRREQECWLDVRRFRRHGRVETNGQRIDGWPIHEPGWQREILRTTFQPTED